MPLASGLGVTAMVMIQGGPTKRRTWACHCLSKAAPTRMVNPGGGIEREMKLDPVRLAVDCLGAADAAAAGMPGVEWAAGCALAGGCVLAAAGLAFDCVLAGGSSRETARRVTQARAIARQR